LIFLSYKKNFKTDTLAFKHERAWQKKTNYKLQKKQKIVIFIHHVLCSVYPFPFIQSFPSTFPNPIHSHFHFLIWIMDWRLILKKWSRYLWGWVPTKLHRAMKKKKKNKHENWSDEGQRIFNHLRNEFLPLKSIPGRADEKKYGKQKSSSSKANEIVVYLHDKVSFTTTWKYQKFSQFQTSLFAVVVSRLKNINP
jgi:hypothetical protein